MKEDLIKSVVLKAHEFIEEFEKATESLEDADKIELLTTAGKTIGLRDTARFNLAFKIAKRHDLQELRRELVSAIADEKWKEGFLFAIQLLSVIGGR